MVRGESEPVSALLFLGGDALSADTPTAGFRRWTGGIWTEGGRSELCSGELHELRSGELHSDELRSVEPSGCAPRKSGTGATAEQGLSLPMGRSRKPHTVKLLTAALTTVQLTTVELRTAALTTA